jgi:CIC family chloride channel protein
MQGDSTIADTDDVRLKGKAASAARSATGRSAVRRARRPIGSAVLHAPQVLRALVRTDEIWLVVLAAFIGCATGISV